MRLNSLPRWCIVACVLASGPVRAADISGLASNIPAEGIHLKPVVVQSSQGGGQSLGIDYDLSKVVRGDIASSIWPSSESKGQFLSQSVIGLKGRGSLNSGTQGVHAEAHEWDITAAQEFQSLPIYVLVGLSAQVQAAQNLDRRHTLWGMRGLVAKASFLTPGDTASMRMLYSTVKPEKDPQRLALLGHLESFKRWNLESRYELPVMRKGEKSDDPVWQKLRNLEFGYRHSQEIGAPSLVRAAGLVQHRMGYVRLSLAGDYFIQYAQGRQAFDPASGRSVKVGWELKLSHSTHPGAHELEASPPFANS
jgi:hypothetical protein